MNKHLLTKLLALAFVGFFQTAEAATLNLQFTDGTNIHSFAKDAFFDVNIYINGVSDLAGFDFDLTYNSNNLFAQSLTSSSIFGAGTEALASINTITPGVGAALGKIHFAELLSGSVTTGLHIDTPTLLGTVKFKALNVSTGNALGITDDLITSPGQLLMLSNGDGPNTGVTGATVHVTAALAAVPLPASAFLFVPGLLGVFGIRRKRAVKS